MTFLSPALLLLGAAVAVPLVLHLLQRHQGPRLVFPALRYLRRAEREHATRIRLRQVLLLALRVLALLLLAAAAARPFLRGRGAGHQPTSVVLVLDNSLSSAAVVGDRRVIDALKESALRTLEGAGGDDRFWLVRAGSPWQPAVAGGARAVAAAVRATEPSGGGADLVTEIERASSILASEPAERPREVHVLSDLQASGFTRSAPAPETAPAVVALVPETGTPPNRGVTAVEVGGGLPPRGGERSTVTATLTGGGAADSVTARLVLGDVVRAAATVPAGASAVLSFPALDPGVVVGRVEIDADALHGDDRRHFVTRVTPPPSVALTARLPFLDEALGVLEEARRIRRGSPAAADVLLAPGGVGVEAVRSGSAVVVLPPASSLELPAANQRLASADVPWRFAPPQGGEARIATEALSDELGAVLGDARLRQVYGLERQGAAADSVLLRLEDGEPWAVTGATASGGRYVLLATPLTPEGGTIPTSAAMVPLLDRIIAGWAAAAAPSREHRPGEVVTLPPSDSIVPPDGPADPARAGAIYRLERPGVYRVYRDGALASAYAVNPPAAESDLARIDEASLAAALPGRELVTASADAWPEAVYRQRLGHETSLPLVVLALVLLLIEMLLAAAGRGRAASGTVPASQTG